MAKTVLFVTYGGGHATMVAPVIRALAGYPDIETQTLALTLGGPYFRCQGLSYLGFKDFLLPQDTEALAWGKKLSAIYHQPETGIEEEESVAYLGLSYWDLVTRHGEAEAAKMWQAQQRNSFLPLTVMERIIKRLRPDMVVTTNSPRSEQAAVTIANTLGIPTLSMVDLFGLLNLQRMEANYITVLSQQVIDNILQDRGSLPGQEFLITGNPAFDPAFDHRGPIDVAWRREHFPALPDGAKTLLWLDDNAYIDPKTYESTRRSDEDIVKDLDDLAQATKQAGGYLLIRPHPSQQRGVFDAWMQKTAHPHVLFAGHVPLYPLLRASDAVANYTSTAALEALLVGRPVIQLKYYRGKINMDLGEWDLAQLVQTPEQLPEIVRKVFYEPSQNISAKVAAILPQEKAAPKIAQAINAIVHSREGRLKNAI